jgi:tetratricopeptide (TPR) repeat protein
MSFYPEGNLSALFPNPSREFLSSGLIHFFLPLLLGALLLLSLVNQASALVQDTHKGWGNIQIAQLKIRSSINPILEKGIAEYRAENFEEAVALFNKVREQEPENGLVYFYLGLINKQVGNLPEAARNLKESLGTSPPVLDAYAELIDALYNMNQIKEAREWLVKAEAVGHEPAKIAFLKGLIALKEEKNREAVSAFNQAKKMDPSLTQAADFQIAVALVQDRRLIEARDSLRAVLARDPASELAAVAKEYEGALGKTLADYKAWRFTVGLGVQYDTNVVLKPSGDVPGVLISNDNDGSVTNSFRVDYSPLLRGPWFFSGQYSFNANTYFNLRSFNMQIQSVSLNPGYLFPTGSISLPLNYNYVWLKECPYMSLGGAKPTLTLIPFPGHSSQLSLGYAKRAMQQGSLSPDEDRDASLYSGSWSYIYPFWEGRGFTNFKYEITKDNTQGKNWENLGNRFSLGLLLPLHTKINFIISGDLSLQDYTSTHSVFGVKRTDKIYTGSALISWQVWPQLTFNLQYTYTQANSNIAIYDYTRNLTSLECEYRF